MLLVCNHSICLESLHISNLLLGNPVSINMFKLSRTPDFMHLYTHLRILFAWISPPALFWTYFFIAMLLDIMTKVIPFFISHVLP